MPLYRKCSNTAPGALFFRLTSAGGGLLEGGFNRVFTVTCFHCIIPFSLCRYLNIALNLLLPPSVKVPIRSQNCIGTRGKQAQYPNMNQEYDSDARECSE